MVAVFVFFAKMLLSSAVLFLYYYLFLKDRTFHHYNRFYLMIAAAASLLLPILRLDFFSISIDANLYKIYTKLHSFSNAKSSSDDAIYFSVAFGALALVALIFLTKLLYGIVQIFSYKRSFPKTDFGQIIVYRTPLEDAPFSFFKHLFWKQNLDFHSDLGQQILRHEMVHIQQKHSFDKIFLEILTSLFWFNPFFHLLKKELFLIHEYLADHRAVAHHDVENFAQMILAGQFSPHNIAGGNAFFSSNIKKRIKMLQKPSTKNAYVRRIFALPLLFSIAFAYMVNAKNKEIEATNNELKKSVLKKMTAENSAKVFTDSAENLKLDFNIDSKDEIKIDKRELSRKTILLQNSIPENVLAAKSEFEKTEKSSEEKEDVLDDLDSEKKGFATVLPAKKIFILRKINWEKDQISEKINVQDGVPQLKDIIINGKKISPEELQQYLKEKEVGKNILHTIESIVVQKSNDDQRKEIKIFTKENEKSAASIILFRGN